MAANTQEIVKLAVIGDLVEENWPSMELAAEMIVAAARVAAPERLGVELLQPAMRRRFTRGANKNGRRFNADRLLNRFWDYPRWLRTRRDGFALFHLADHSYAQIAHELPPERLLITCHDLDTFRCLWGEDGPRPKGYDWLVRRTLAGLQRAARVLCVSQATADELLARRLVKPERVRVTPNPAHPVFGQTAEAAAFSEATRLLGDSDAPFLLHVGSVIPRKRLDVLLQVFAAARRNWPHLRLLRVGGALTLEQQALAESLGVAEALVTLPPLSREVLAAVYQRAALTLLPSEREGFGWPLVESLASGAPVLASDLPVLREVGGNAAEFAPVADVAAWTRALDALLREKMTDAVAWQARQTRARVWATQFSLAAYGENLATIYQELVKF